MNTIGRILGEAKRPPTEMELTDPIQAYKYAKYVIKGRFPEGEAAIATSPWCACIYAMYAIEGRFPEGEEAIAKNSEYSKAYLKEFPEAKMEFFANRWIDWTQL